MSAPDAEPREPAPDHLLEVLEDDETVPPRAEEQAADAARDGTAPTTPPPGEDLRP